MSAHDKISIANILGFVETSSGLLVPDIDNIPGNPISTSNYYADGNRIGVRGKGVLRNIKGEGVHLSFDDDSGVAFWPSYASGLDDYLMRAITRGYMVNGGRTPVLISMLSTIVAKRQAMAGTWTTTITGKRSPVKRMSDLLSRADDSDYGPSDFVQAIIGALDVDNRGAIIAQVPISTLPFDSWESMGMTAEPVSSQNKQKQELFVLRMTSEAFRANQGIWAVDGLTCLPTGNREWPYWIRKSSRDLKKDVWVLIHKDFGFQIIQHNGPKNSMYPGVGQSGTWRFSPYVVKHMAVNRMDWEHLMMQPMRGIVWASGLDQPTQFRDQIIKYREEREENDVKFYPGIMFGGSMSDKSAINIIPWTEPPVGYTPQTWIDEVVSNLAASFHMNETHLRLKLGEGAMTQSGVAEAIEAETSISWMRQKIEEVWNRVAPPRTIVTVVWQSDRVTRFQIESFREFSLGVSRLQKLTPGAENPDEEPIFTRQEIRAMIEQEIGLSIPEAANDPDTETVNDRSDPDGQIEQSMGDRFNKPKGNIITLAASPLPPDQKFAVGNRVKFVDDKSTAVISGWSGTGDWVWVIKGRYEMLVSAKRLCPIDTKRNLDRSTNALTLQVEVEGDPLEPVDEWIIDRDTAVTNASQLWQDIDPDQLGTLFIGWTWDVDAKVWTEDATGQTRTHDEMLAARNDFALGTSDIYAEEDEDSLIFLLILGLITLGEWETRMREALEATRLAQYASAAGGFDNLTDDDYRVVEEDLNEQFGFLTGFSIAIGTGLLSQAVVIQRARAYFSQSVESFEKGKANAYGLMLTVWPGDGSSICLANDRCYWSIVEFDDQVRASWIRTVAESCLTCISRANCPPVVLFKDTGVQTGMECYEDA